MRSILIVAALLAVTYAFMPSAAMPVGKFDFSDHNETSMPCALCGIAINEIEAMMIENQTDIYIQKKLRDDVCSKFPGVGGELCDAIVVAVPEIISSIDARDDVGRVCVGLKFCPMPFAQYADPVPAPIFNVNLDLPPNQRWVEICSMPLYKDLMTTLIDSVSRLLPNDGRDINAIGEDLNNHYFPQELAQEIQGCASAMGVPYGWLSIVNIGYELSDACTSILSQDVNGNIYHSRNLDFWSGWGFTDLLRNLTLQANMQVNGETKWMTTTMAGYVGVLSGIRPGAFALTINTRFYPNGVGELFEEVIAGLKEKNASLVTFLSRNVMQYEVDFPTALKQLSNTELVADVFYTLSGVSAGEGAIITRNRTQSVNTWMLNAPSHWFEVITNYDHWVQPPWIDDRVKPANDSMIAMGQENISFTNLMKVMSYKPVLNLQTTHTILACPATGAYQSYERFCNFPCTE